MTERRLSREERDRLYALLIKDTIEQALDGGACYLAAAAGYLPEEIAEEAAAQEVSVREHHQDALPQHTKPQGQAPQQAGYLEEQKKKPGRPKKPLGHVGQQYPQITGHFPPQGGPEQ